MKSTGMLIAAAALMAAAGTAQAAPANPMSGLGGEAPITQVRGGCGFGEHRGPMGGCRLNRGPRGAIRRSITGAPRGCPPYMHRGPYGGCRR